MVLCAVAGCRAYYNIKSIKTNNGEPLSFFHLPHDPDLKAEWMARCNIDHIYNIKNARVCSLHFQKDDFDSSYLTKCAFGLKPARPYLHKHAVPSLRLPASGLDSLLDEYAGGEDDESSAVHAPQRGPSPPLDPYERANIVEEAISDMLRREQERCDANLRMLSSLSTPRKKLAGDERASAKKRKMAAKENLSTCTDNDGTTTSMKSEVFLLPKGGPIIRKVTFVKSEVEAEDDDEDDVDDLGQRLKEIRRMQRRTSVLEQKLAAKQRQLQEVLLQQAAASAALTSLTGRKPGRRKRVVDVEGVEQMTESAVYSTGDPLMVLRSDEHPAEQSEANDMLTVPADLVEAKRIIFGLRQEVLTLRNTALKHAHTTTAQRIDAIGKDVKRDVRQAAIVKRLRDALGSVFSRAQQSRILKGKKIVPWESEDYMRAISLRTLCRRRTFEFVRNTMKIPLPSMFALRSAAAFGRFPEVSHGFKELREQKRLRFITAPARAKHAAEMELDPLETVETVVIDNDDDMPDQLTLERFDPVERPSPRRRVGRGRGGRGRGGAGAARKRKWRSEEEEEELLEQETQSPQKQCWNAVDFTELIEFEHDEHSSSIDDAWSRHVQSSLGVLSPPRGRGRGRGVNRQRAPRTMPPGGGKRAPSHSGGLTFAHEL